MQIKIYSIIKFKKKDLEKKILKIIKANIVRKQNKK